MVPAKDQMISILSKVLYTTMRAAPSKKRENQDENRLNRFIGPPPLDVV